MQPSLEGVTSCLIPRNIELEVTKESFRVLQTLRKERYDLKHSSLKMGQMHS